MRMTLTLDFQYAATTIEKLRAALTDPEKLAKWGMENNFKPEVGYRFQFRQKPTEWWDGIVEGEVLIVDEPNKLSYMWGSAGEKHTVVWTLQELGGGKVNLHLEQSGISNVQALHGAKYGWNAMGGELEKLLAQ
ncbi:SRPBCC domain-containing protein [Paenibacillus lycopersici]|uniref:SRPBCC domain-containing protein n=1 Tax=Paenibacillus lycopersici TaxID=2704462 RepID=A0A6C0FZN5_9BACL|nr:SRPBCC domain-containing protein [Paenibacillus lycopersici]QHT60941.1 SRPBCC domain-containing protein [Paenibacillus lycopersici]